MAGHCKKQRPLLHGEMQTQTPRAVLSPSPHCAGGKPTVVSVPGRGALLLPICRGLRAAVMRTLELKVSINLQPSEVQGTEQDVTCI